MSSMPWVKLYTEMLDDPKIGRLPDAIKWRFVSLVLLAGECDQDGFLSNSNEPMSLDDVAWRMRVTREQCETELASLVKVGLLEDIDGAYLVTKFSERQGRPQSEKRAQWRERKARQRDIQETPENVTRESRENHAPRVDKSREEKSRKESSPDGESATKKSEPEVKPLTPRQAATSALEIRFSSLSGLPLPKRDTEKDKKAGASRWWNPLAEIWEMCGKDTDKAAQIIEKAYRKMIADELTISAPQSVLEVAKSIYSKNGHGTQSPRESAIEAALARSFR